MSALRPTFTPALFSREEAAYYLRMSTRKFNDLIQTKRVIPHRMDGMKVYRKADLDELVESLPEWEDAA